MGYQFERIDAYNCIVDGVEFGPVICPNMTAYSGKVKYGIAPKGMSCKEFRHRYHPGSMPEVKGIMDLWEAKKDAPKYKLEDDLVLRSLVDFDLL